ncbi:MAG TPA: amidophosphoribosyltransferase [Actinomycetota bacterium]|nr:amidophosphoribosyltransferase [Actinomycetota bacterium]
MHLTSGRDKPQEACGVVGIYAPGQEVSKLTYNGLLALQHRGQESAGITVNDGGLMTTFKEMGLVAQVFNENVLNSLTGDMAIGHVRYSTTGSSVWENAQPIYRHSRKLGVALGHNGNLVNAMRLAEELGAPDRGPGAAPECSNDSDLIAEMIVTSGAATVEEGILSTLPKLEGAFSLVMLDDHSVFGARDPHGLRPLVIGSLDVGGYAIASETAALDTIGATFLREVEPGELVTIDAQGIRSHRYAEATPALCVFEYVYFARPDSILYGKSVQKARYQMGKKLADESPAEADIVIPVPDSGRGAAAGYSQASGLPYVEGFVKNAYVGRTFIQPSQAVRQRGIGAKLNPIVHLIEGKRLVVVDDSIVRGNTTRQIVRLLRHAGAAEVHMRISSPPIKWPCFYGIDTANRDELIGGYQSVEEIRAHIEADSLAYLSEDGMIEATEVAADKLCTACFSSNYPIPVPDEVKVTKNMLERI